MTFGFWQPVRLSLMPNLVPREEIPIAIALNSSIFRYSIVSFIFTTAPSLKLRKTKPEQIKQENIVSKIELLVDPDSNRAEGK